jgi:sulfur carrier protein ThiS
MKVTFKLFASLQDYLPVEAKRDNALQLDIAEGTTIVALIERHGLPMKSCHLVLVDGHFVPPDQRGTRALQEGETLAIWPPIAGG